MSTTKNRCISSIQLLIHDILSKLATVAQVCLNSVTILCLTNFEILLGFEICK